MLTLLDELLRTMLMDRVDGLRPAGGGTVEFGQVGFEPPDDVWRRNVSSLQRSALNVYLVDVRENRKLRSNERTRSIENGDVYESPAPSRLDCYYLISAWTSGMYTTGSLQPTIEPTRDEHMLLYEVARVLIQNSPFNPSRIYPAGSAALNAWPESFRDADLPMVLAPVEGFPKLAEFWGTMGQTHPWKPVIYLIVTIPVELLTEVVGAMVTTRITEYRLVGMQESGEVFIEIGGHVTASPEAQPIVGAWVALENASGTLLQTAETDPKGRFKFAGLQNGNYTLRVRAQGFDEATRSIEVPSPSGEYNVHLN